MNIQFTLLSLAQDFSDYYAEEMKDPEKDMVRFFSTPLLVSDEEFRQYISGINELTKKYMNRSPGENRKSRKITFVASPAGGKEGL